jgi:hypothetical protein
LQWNYQELARDQQGPGQPDFQKISIYINGLKTKRRCGRIAAALPFLPGGKICRLRPSKEVTVQVTVIASRQYGLY